MMNKHFYKQQKPFLRKQVFSGHRQLILSFDSTSQRNLQYSEIQPPILAHGYRISDDDDDDDAQI